MICIGYQVDLGVEVSYLTVMPLSLLRKLTLINNINQYSAHIYVFPTAHKNILHVFVYCLFEPRYNQKLHNTFDCYISLSSLFFLALLWYN